MRKKFEVEKDREGLRLVRETGLKGKNRARMIAGNEKVEQKKRDEKAEIAQWFTLWLQMPAAFEDWVAIRQTAKDFIEKFGDDDGNRTRI